jgi:16S rRNA (uracil1498-N3)-methyltransferase
MNQLFYTPSIQDGLATLDEEESRHLIMVMRRKIGDRLWVTDGLGHYYEAEIVETGKKNAFIRIVAEKGQENIPTFSLHLAIAPTKQMERLEWFVEKATEIGIDEITPLLCQRSERDKLRIDRLQKTALSAMKQSLRARLPKINELTPYPTFIKSALADQKYIPWCADAPQPHLQSVLAPTGRILIMIGPEGDFSTEEVTLAQAHGFMPVSLGAARLRTETAALYAVNAVQLAGVAVNVLNPIPHF